MRMYAFDQLKKEGIQQKNLCTLGRNGDDLHCEQRSERTKVMCSSCKGFYKEYFYRHRKHCLKATKVTLTATSSSAMPTAEPDEEWGHVLEGMKTDSAYVTITADEVIKVIGRDVFAARKPNKKREAMVKARRAMRRVARLKQAVRVNSSQELFFFENIREVELAMNNMCCVEDNLKAGLKLALGTLIKQCCAILIVQYATSCQRSVADQIREFKDVFSSPTHCAKLMATAEYQLKEKRQRQNHKPSHLLDEADLAKLMAFLDEELASTTDITSTGAFVQARKVALAHVTLLNARRGSEAARLLLFSGSKSRGISSNSLCDILQ